MPPLLQVVARSLARSLVCLLLRRPLVAAAPVIIELKSKTATASINAPQDERAIYASKGEEEYSNEIRIVQW